MQQSSTPTPEPARPFAAWIAERLRELGYDLSPRGGGRAQFAADAGISASSVTRLLHGRGLPDATLLAKIAPVLKATLPDLLVRAGICTREEISRAAEPRPAGRPITAEQAAAELGIQSNTAVQLFVSMVQTMQDQEAMRRSQEARRMET